MYKFMNSPYMEADKGGGSGAGDGQKAGEGDDPEGEDPDEDGEDEQDEKKFSQKEIDDAVQKRLAREKKKWQREQQKPPAADGKKDEGSTEDKDKAEAIQKAESLEVKIACYEADVAKDSIDDVVALAKAYMAADKALDLEDAIEKVVKKYPQFKKGAADPYEQEGTTGKGSWGQRQSGKGAKKIDPVEAAFLKRNPGLKID